MKFQERTSTKKSEAGMTGWNVLTWVRIHRRAARASVYFMLKPDCLQDAKGLIPREVVIVKLDPAKFKKKSNSTVKYPKLSL